MFPPQTIFVSIPLGLQIQGIGIPGFSKAFKVLMQKKEIYFFCMPSEARLEIFLIPMYKMCVIGTIDGTVEISEL